MIPQRNPYAFDVPINDRFLAVIDPHGKNGSHVLNMLQASVWNEIDGKRSHVDIAKKCNLDGESINSVLMKLTKLGLVSEGGRFVSPSFTSPKMIDIWLHLTNACNLRCTYCHVHKDKGHMSIDVLDQLEKKLIQTIRERKIKQVRLRLAGGEPMLRLHIMGKKLESMKMAIEKEGCKFHLAFLTNLTILNQEIINFIKRTKASVSVSMDGLAAFHDTTRIRINGKGSFNEITANIDRLQDAGIDPFVMIVVSPDNQSGLTTFVREFLLPRNLGFALSPVYSFCGGEHVDQMELGRVINDCYDLIEKHIESGSRFFHKHRFRGLSFFGPSQHACNAGHRSFSLQVNGDIHFCQSTHHLRSAISNIFTDGRDLLTIIKDQNVVPEFHYNDCTECKVRYICSAGCPLERMDGKSPRCALYQTLIPKIMRLVAKEKLIQFFLKN